MSNKTDIDRELLYTLTRIEIERDTHIKSHNTAHAAHIKWLHRITMHANIMNIMMIVLLALILWRGW